MTSLFNTTRRIACFLFVVVVFVVSHVPILSAQSVQDFTIESFSADYYLNRTDKQVATMSVVERIVAVFPETDQNHGILRAIPATYRTQNLSLSIDAVEDSEGGTLQHDKYNEGDNVVLKIGDPNTYVHGRKTYVIKYSLKNPVTFYDNHDELYWDVNGDQWPQQFGQVVARIHMPESISNALLSEQRCYTGRYGSSVSNCEIALESGDNEKILTFSSDGLNAYETLSFVVGFKKTTFLPDYEAQQQEMLKQRIGVLLLIGIPVLVLLTLLRQWYKYGRDDTGKGTIVPQYTPYSGLNPLLSDTLLHDGFRSNAIAAVVVELAVQKYITIHATEKKGMLWGKSTTYELELLRNPSDVSSMEHDIVAMFFSTATVGERVSLSSLSHKLYNDVAKLKKRALTSLTTTGYFKHDPDKIKATYRVVGVLLLAVSIGLLLLVEPLKTLGFVVGGTLIGTAISGLIALVMARYMPAKTALGVEARDYLYGLRDYIKLAEAERLQYLQSPEGVKQYGDPKDATSHIKLFEKLLPYAMIFGLEKEWAKQFEDLYSQPPEWYSSNVGTFNSIYLAQSIGGFANASSSSFTPPSSSGSSGFSGGGFSGGGGGGGGGGGW